MSKVLRVNVKSVQLIMWKLPVQEKKYIKIALFYCSIILYSFHLTEDYWFHIFEQNYSLSQLISQNWCCSMLEQVSGAEPGFWQRLDHKTYGSKLGGKTTIERKKKWAKKKNTLQSTKKCCFKLLMSRNSFTNSETINHKKVSIFHCLAQQIFPLSRSKLVAKRYSKSFIIFRRSDEC